MCVCVCLCVRVCVRACVRVCMHFLNINSEILKRFTQKFEFCMIWFDLLALMSFQTHETLANFLNTNVDSFNESWDFCPSIENPVNQNLQKQFIKVPLNESIWMK